MSEEMDIRRLGVEGVVEGGWEYEGVDGEGGGYGDGLCCW